MDPRAEAFTLTQTRTWERCSLPVSDHTQLELSEDASAPSAVHLVQLQLPSYAYF